MPVVADVDVEERVVLDVDLGMEIPCEFVSIHESRGTQIGVARWRIYWNRERMCGCALAATSLACDDCKEVLMTDTVVECGCCGGPGHTFISRLIIKKIEPL